MSHRRTHPQLSLGKPRATSWGLLSGRWVLAVVAVMVAALFAPLGGAATAATAAPASGVVAAGVQLKAKPAPAVDFGDNVTIFDDTWTTAEVQAKFDEIHALQVSNEMGTERYGLYFLPGTYGSDDEPLQAKVGYYTEVAGLGASPGDVQINGTIEVYNQCFDDPDNPEFIGCFALNNFWRGLSNLTINVNTLGQDGCAATANMWAVSQAVSMRRVDVKGGDLTLMDYCTQPAYASGGYIADSKVSDPSLPGQVLTNGSQQQWYARNSEVGTWSNAVWNQVFSGMDFTDPSSAPMDATYPDPPYTVLDETPVSREKPYLYVTGQGAYMVRVPSAHRNTSGVTWDDGMTPGRSIPISDFFIADPSDSAQTINSQLARGKNLILTPGVYDVDKSIQVKRADTVVLGMGLATLTAVNGAIPLTLADRPGIIVAGVTIDAGTVESPILVRIGTKNGNNGTNTVVSNNPTTLNDVYFRVGGPHVGKVDIAMEVNSDNVLIDHTWVWRADHGVEGFDREDGAFGDNERWRTNIGRNGVVVNGDDVTATGLFVEHFQEYNTIWNGENGRVILYQNELPYDPPSQADWMADDGTLGWAAYKVADNVKKHQLWGGGAYVFNRNDPSIVTENGFEVPDTPGVTLTHVMTKNLSGPGTINHVVNGIGDAVDGVPSGEGPSYVVNYPPVPDTTPPTVAITDNVPGDTATGDVTFTFTFSEDVGTSFTTDDIGLAGGTKGTFTRVDGRHATLLAQPPAATTGTLDVSVATGTFTDLAGNDNTAAATAQQNYDTTITAPPSGAFVITFDEATPPVLTDFGDNQSSLVEDPTNASNQVAQIVKLSGAQTWAGTTVSTEANQAVPVIPFTATTTTMTARVWSADAGIPVRLKAENANDPGQSVETDTTTTVAGAWETLTFDFANHAAGTAALNPALTYDKVSIFFDFGSAGTGKTYFLDDLTWPEGGTTPPPPSGDLVITFDEATPPVLTGFWGAEDSTIVADPDDASNMVGRAVKSAATAAFYAGTTVSTGPDQSVPDMPFTATRAIVTMRVYSEAAGTRVRMKVENALNPGINCEGDAFTTVAGAWETLTWDFYDTSTHYIPSGPGPTDYDLTKPTAPLNAANVYNKVSVFYNYGVGGSGYAPMTADETWYFDDLDLQGAGGGGGVDTTPPTVAVTDNVADATATGDVLFTFAFSEDVGTSFTADDIDLTGGTKGAFTRVDAFTATLVAQPPVDATGTLVVSVAAGTFTDLAGNANTAAVSAQQDYVTPLPFVITFDEATPPVLTGFWGAEDSTIVADPDDASNMVGRAVKSAATAAFYAGTTVSTGPDQSVPDMPFTATRAIVTMRVYSEAAGTRVRMKVENALNPGINCEGDAFTTVAGAWETLTWDFYDTSTHYIPSGPGPTDYDLTKPTAPLNAANVYNKVSVFYNYGVGGSGYAPMTADETWYFDDLAF